MASVVVIRIKHKFRLRFVEWLASFQLMIMGWVLLGPYDSMQSPNFAFMRQLADETTWAVVLFAVGFTRLCGLIINGSMEGVTSTIRTVGAFIGFNCFFLISLSLLVSYFVAHNPPSIGIAMFLPACGAEIAAIICATYDARVYQNGRRSGLV